MGDVIKSFLVSLSFGVDDESLAKFNKSIETASARVLALYGAIKLMAAGVFFTISKISQGFEELGYEYKILAPAINKALILRMELMRAYKAAGVNIVQVVQSAVRFNLALTKTQYVLQAIYRSVASRFFPLLTRQLDSFRLKLYANMPKIQNALERFITFVFKAFEASVTLGERIYSILSRVYDFFKRLDELTNGWSTVVLGLVAAWKLLNLSFLATPLGMIIAGLTAILLLFDDYRTWQEGGKSLFDWSYAVPIINQIATAMSGLSDIISDAFDIVFNLSSILIDLSNLKFDSLLQGLTNINDALVKILHTFWTNPALNKIADFLLPGSGQLMNFIGNLGNNNGALSNMTQPTYPLGNLGAGMVNQNVQQQTSINVNGSPDANATGKAVADQQTRVNFDIVRNFKANAQ